MLKTFSATDTGKKRNINQDYVFTSETPVGKLPNLFLVADGMGGHKAGDYASRVTVETMIRIVEEETEEASPEELFQKAISGANSLIYEQASKEESLEGMGTTVVAAVCEGSRLYVANVGDSRLYVIHDEITQITIDHSLVEEMVRRGTIGKVEARNHPDKNIITRAVGVNSQVEVDLFRVELMPGDLILMCSDGLTNMLEDEEIRMIVKRGRDLVEMVQNLVDAANRNGGTDNISVVLIDPLA